MDFKKTLHRRRFEQKLVETQPVALSPEALEARESLLAFASYVAPNVIHQGITPHNIDWANLLQTEEDSSCLHRIAGKNSVILAPRGFGKSAWISLFVAWSIGHNRGIQIIYASSSESIAISKGRTIRRLIESIEYQQVFPHIRPSKTWGDRIWEIDKKHAGVSALESDFTFYAVGITGSIVSRRSHLIIGDDIIKGSGGTSKNARSTVRNTFYEALIPTLVPGGRVIVGGTRFHEKDIFGTDLTEDKGWTVLTHRAIETDDDGFERSSWPGYFSLDRLQNLRRANPRAFELQFQNQAPKEGEVGFQPEWFSRGDIPRTFDQFVVGIDLASSLKSRGDFTCFTIAGVLWRHRRHRWILQQHQGRWQGNNAKSRELLKFIREWQTHLREGGEIVVYAEGSGYQASFATDFNEYLRQSAQPLPIHPRLIYPKGDKLERLENYSGAIESGRVIFNRYLLFDDLFSQILDFGVADHDDRVDSLVYALNGLSLYPPLEASSW